MKCETCKFWDNQLDDQRGNPAYGECRRYPPSTKVSGKIQSATYGGHFMVTSNFETITHNDDWCGEYVEKPEHE